MPSQTPERENAAAEKTPRWSSWIEIRFSVSDYVLGSVALGSYLPAWLKGVPWELILPASVPAFLLATAAVHEVRTTRRPALLLCLIGILALFTVLAIESLSSSVVTQQVEAQMLKSTRNRTLVKVGAILVVATGAVWLVITDSRQKAETALVVESELSAQGAGTQEDQGPFEIGATPSEPPQELVSLREENTQLKQENTNLLNVERALMAVQHQYEDGQVEIERLNNALALSESERENWKKEAGVLDAEVKALTDKSNQQATQLEELKQRTKDVNEVRQQLLKKVESAPTHSEYTADNAAAWMVSSQTLLDNVAFHRRNELRSSFNEFQEGEPTLQQFQDCVESLRAIAMTLKHEDLGR
jgi:hypothetical protein